MSELNDTNRWLAGDADGFMAAIGVKTGQTVLDFGCGKGHYSIPAAKAVGNHGRLYALDKSADALNGLRASALHLGLNHIETFDTHGDVLTPLEEASADVVLLHDVLHLIGWEERDGRTIRKSTSRDRRNLLEEVYRVMKWDGLLSVFCPHLATHTDATSEYALIQEIASAGFRLEREVYRQLIHDDRFQQGHLCSFRKRRTCAQEGVPFTYDSASFQNELRHDDHPFGEVTILTSVVEPGMIVIEIGANRGVSTVALARSAGSAGQVRAFEPVPEFYAALVNNLRLNEVANAQVHQLAITDKESVTPYYKHGEGSGIVQVDESEAILVGTASLDHFMKAENLGRVDFINMDCEGAELLALRGATDTLARHAPRVLCEIHHDYLARLGQSAGDIVAYLYTLGFRVTPVRVEQLDEDVELKDCTHVYAVKGEALPDMKSIYRRQQEAREFSGIP